MAAAKPARHKQQQHQQQQQYPSPPQLHAVEQPASLADAEPPTSRLCVKNIPKYLPEERLKDHFSVKGQVTDIKILKTRDGQPRQMAFVGYRSVDDAASALKYFNNTFIDTCRISIEYARRYRSYEPPAADGQAAAAAAAADAHRPWSKYSAGSSKHQQLAAKAAAAAAAPEDAAAAAAADKATRKAKREAKRAKKAAGVVGEAAEADPKLAEFLELMQPRAKAKIWSNDEVLPAGQAGKAAAAAAAAAAGKAGARAEEEPDDLYEDLPAAAAAARRANGAGAFKGGSDSDDDHSSSSQSGSEDDTDPLAAKDAVVVDEGVSDLDYLRARMRKAPAAGAAAAAAAAAAGSSEDGEDSSSSSSSGESDDGFDEETERAARRQRQHMVSTSDSSGSESDDSEGGGSDGDVMHLQQQQQRRLAGGKQLKQQGPDGGGPEPSESGEDDDSEGVSAWEDQQQQDAGGDDPMAVDEEEPVQGQGSFPAAAAAAAADGCEPAAAEGSIRESGRLFVRNLAYTAGQVELSELFGAYGDLEEVHLVLDRDTRRSKGIAYIKYLLPEDAVAAFRALDMTPFQGRLLHLLPAKRKPGEDVDDKADKEGPTGYKADKEAQRRRDAGNRSAWSTLFMRADTVAAAVAAHYGVSKAQLLDSAAEDLPLRMALGEAQVIAQTKAALADMGVNAKALETAAAASGSAAATRSVSRSSSTLLVKNLPYGADADELLQLFTGPGRSVLRLVLPPTKTLAVVEFSEPQDARAAFKALAYKKYQQVPLYLEWAPKDIWDTPPPAAPATVKAAATAAGAGAAAPAAPAASKRAGADAGADAGAASGQLGEAGAGAAASAAAVADEDEDGQAPTVSIYVKNLNFSTSDASLKNHFDKAVSAAGGRIHSAKVARRKGSDGKLLSMGYGFVETDSEAAAKTAIKQLQGSMLDKHKLTLQLSKRSATGSGAAGSSKASKKASKEAADGKGAKLVVRNVAFEATKKDIMGLFGPFGHLKSCRLPKKFDGNHRGFAFLEFTTKQEAGNALEGVGGTHLYGRRLVVEYAAADAEGLAAGGEPADMAAARAKTAAKFFGSGGWAGAGGEGEGGAEADAPARKRMKRNL